MLLFFILAALPSVILAYDAWIDEMYYNLNENNHTASITYGNKNYDSHNEIDIISKDMANVIRAISEGSNLNIQITGREVNISNQEYIGNIVKFNFTPNGFDLNDKRVFMISMANSKLEYKGHKIILRKSLEKIKEGDNYTYTFFIVDTDIQPRFSFTLLIGNNEDTIPILFLNDGKGNTRAFYIALCNVIGADGSILLPSTYIRGREQKTLKMILENIAKTVELE